MVKSLPVVPFNRVQVLAKIAIFSDLVGKCLAFIKVLQ